MALNTPSHTLKEAGKDFAKGFGGAAVVVGGAGCVITSIVKAHDCDVTKSGTWSAVHTTVLIEKKSALLNQSFLMCKKGGKVTIVMDSVLAATAAQQISDYNNALVKAQMDSQFKIGVITTLAALPGGTIGLISAAVLAVPSYWFGEDKPISHMVGKDFADTPYAGTAIETVTATGAGLAAPGAAITAAGYATYATGVATKKISTQFMGGVLAAIGAKNIKTSFQPSAGLGAGLAGAVLSYLVGSASDAEESKYSELANKTQDETSKENAKKSISIVALTK